jgi:hypothetical protein
MRNIRYLPLFGLLLTFTLTNTQMAHAVIFDGAEFLHPKQQAVGVMGDLLLSNPSGEGASVHFKQGVNDLVNAQGIFGYGSMNRRYRIGAQANINFFPDAPGQIGISLLSGGMFIQRLGYKAMQFFLTPLVGKEMDGYRDYPINVYVGMPFFIELASGRYKTGSQLAVGAQWDTNNKRQWFLISEAGLSLNNAESYIALGIGTRFGTTPRETSVREKIEDRIDDKIPEMKSKASKMLNKVKTIEPEND